MHTKFLAAEAIVVGIGQGARLAEHVAIGIVDLTRRQGLVGRQEAGDVGIAVGVVVGVAAGGGAGLQATDAPGPHRAAR